MIRIVSHADQTDLYELRELRFLDKFQTVVPLLWHWPWVDPNLDFTLYDRNNAAPSPVSPLPGDTGKGEADVHGAEIDTEVRSASKSTRW